MVRWDPVEVIVVDDSRVILINRVQMRGRGTYVDDVEVQLWTVRDGKAEQLTLYRSNAEALEAAGLREQAMSQENVKVVRRVFAEFSDSLASGAGSSAISRDGRRPGGGSPSGP
jgi:hypothetical protein